MLRPCRACRFGYRDESLFKQEGWHLDGFADHRQDFPGLPKNGSR